jgi:ABC-2 type transport system permease protein
MSSLTRIGAILLRQIYLLHRSPARMISVIIWVAIDMVLWGFFTHYLNDIAQTKIDFVMVLLGGVLLWNFSQRVMFGVTMAFFEDVWSRNFLNLFGSPLTIREYLAGLVLTSILTSALAFVAMLLLAIGIFGLNLLSYGIALMPFLMILFLFGIAIGILGCSLVLRYGPAAEWLVWPIPALLSPFACVFYPVSALPGFMQAIAHLLPPSYVFENVRAITSGHPANMTDMATGIGLGLLYIVLASLVFLRVYRKAVNNGLIARYSAETVS